MIGVVCLDEFNRLNKELRKVRREQLRLYIRHILMFQRARFHKEFRSKQSKYWLSYQNSKIELMRIIKEILSEMRFKIKLKYWIYISQFRRINK